VPGPAPKLGITHFEAETSRAGTKIAVLPDGTNLPLGNVTPAQGARIYAGCRGLPREGGKGGGRAGGRSVVFSGEPLSIGIGVGKPSPGPPPPPNYYAYATTCSNLSAVRCPYHASRQPQG